MNMSLFFSSLRATSLVANFRPGFQYLLCRYAAQEKASVLGSLVCNQCNGGPLNSKLSSQHGQCGSLPFLPTRSYSIKSSGSRPRGKPRADTSLDVIALHDENNKYLTSFTNREARLYVDKHYPDKKMYPTRSENEKGEMIVMLKPKKKSETIFPMTTNIAPGDVQVKIKSIKRKVEKGLRVCVRFSQKREGVGPTVRQSTLDLKPLLEKEGLVAEVVQRGNDSGIIELIVFSKNFPDSPV